MFIPKKIFENNLKNLEGDAIKLYLYRIYFGQDEINQLSKELKMNENKVYKYIEKLNKQNLWDNVLVIQNYLDDIELRDLQRFINICLMIFMILPDSSGLSI